ncbi:MAG: Tn3 family transposase [Desulfobacterales bacterium]|nr:Tn3 family transposase [Desulfobacterales bacterium]
MASIDRTAYPRFKQKLTNEELKRNYKPSIEELKFVSHCAKGKKQQLILMILLKVHQNLGYIIFLKDIPKQIQKYLCNQLGLSEDIISQEDSSNKKSFYRYLQLIRNFLKVRSWSDGGINIAKQAIEKAAYTMSDPADLINVAIEILLQHKYELPAFSTIDRLAGHIRQQVHENLYKKTTSNLDDKQRYILDELLNVKDGKNLTDFNRIKQTPGRASLKQMNLWSHRLDWLCSIIHPEEFIKNIAHTKIRQFASEAISLESGDMKDITNEAKRYTLLLCLIYQAQVQTRDDLVIMFLKRMKSTYNSAKKKLESLQKESQMLEEQMITAFSQVIFTASEETNDQQLGVQIRTILNDYGGIEILMEQYKKISIYHNKNYLPLLWNSHRQHRASIYRLLNLLDIQTATQDKELLQALQFIKENQHMQQDYVSQNIGLEFASQRWKSFVQVQHKGNTVSKRRELEICILSYIADGLRCGDLYVNGSQDFSDYRQQLLPWDECEKNLNIYCDSLNLPKTADDFVSHLQQKLTTAAEIADKLYPENKELTIDKDGKAHLKRIKADPIIEGFDAFKENIRQRLPERHILDILKNVQYWINYTRHFTPPSGSDTKLSDPVLYYLFTVFCYGCNLGAAQTAKHSQKNITLRTLKRINDQHINTKKIEAALNDVINEYIRFDLPFLWGSGHAAIADGTHVELIENNLLGEKHVRYGAYGGIAYHHISDTYIALFSHFIACGVWEAVYILDGLLNNKSKLKPDILHADTQGQNEPVFGLAYLLAIKLMPRMRNWNDVTFYRPNENIIYKHIDSFFTQTVNWQLIKTHWKDLMQVVLSIQAGKVLPSMLLQKLGVYSRKNKLYQAFRELGRVIRTIFLLEYCSDKKMRKEIGAATTKIESFNAFCDWISFGGHVITSGDPVEQEKRIKYMNLIANIIMLHNVVDLTKILNQMATEEYKITKQFVHQLSPYMTEHIKRFGQYILDMNVNPEPLEISKLNLL